MYRAVYDDDWRVCGSCFTTCRREEFSATQWRRGDGVSRCRDCVEEDLGVRAAEPAYAERDRTCCACGERLSIVEFSGNQWAKGAGAARCKRCVAAGRTAGNRPVVTLASSQSGGGSGGGEVGRACRDCGRVCRAQEFSNSQWDKGNGMSRCKICVSGDTWVSSPEEVHSRTSRTNEGSSSARIELRHGYHFAEGKFRYAGKGRYTSGPRTGQVCVGKWFKEYALALAADFYGKDLKTTRKAAEIVQAFNDADVLPTSHVRINMPEQWEQDGRQILVEPWLGGTSGWKKWNSNSGWVCDSGKSPTSWARKMQALSHFSYHITGGQHVLTDLQGAIYDGGRTVILTDPAILSRKANRYGPTDLGPDGISSFFFRHRCSRFCDSSWAMPRECEPLVAEQDSTSMVVSAAQAPHLPREVRVLAVIAESVAGSDDFSDYDDGGW